MTLREQLAVMPPGSLIPRDWVLKQLEGEPADPPRLTLVREAEPETWRTRIWTCPAETRLGVTELAEAFGRPRSWIYRRTSTKAAEKNGRHGRLDMIPHRRLGGELAFVAGEVRDWIRRHERVDVPAPSIVDRAYGAQAGGRR